MRFIHVIHNAHAKHACDARFIPLNSNFKFFKAVVPFSKALISLILSVQLLIRAARAKRAKFLAVFGC